MITASIAVGIILLISHKLGSLNMIVLPIVGGAVAGLIGLLILPYTKLITLGLGDVINGLTNTQPIIMTILIAMIFSILIVSPISSIGIGLAIGISGLAAGSAAVGVAASAIMLAVGSWRVKTRRSDYCITRSSKINDADADSSSNDDATHCLYCRCVRICWRVVQY